MMVERKNVDELEKALTEFTALWGQYKRACEDCNAAKKQAEQRIADEKRHDAERLRLIERAANMGEYLDTGEKNPAFAERDKLLHKAYKWDFVETASFKAGMQVQIALFDKVNDSRMQVKQLRDKAISDLKEAASFTDCFNYDFERRRIERGGM